MIVIVRWPCRRFGSRRAGEVVTGRCSCAILPHLNPGNFLYPLVPVDVALEVVTGVQVVFFLQGNHLQRLVLLCGPWVAQKEWGIALPWVPMGTWHG